MYENSKELIKILKAFLFEEKYTKENNTQIEDIVKRKTGVSADKIRITPLKK